MINLVFTSALLPLFFAQLGREMLPTGTNEPKRTETQKWAVESDWMAKYRTTAEGRVMRFEVLRGGNVPWRPQLSVERLRFEAGKPYTFSIRIRASKKTRLTLLARMAQDPWNGLGFQTPLEIGPTWKTFSYTFFVSESCDDARLDLTGFTPGVFEWADSSLKPGTPADSPGGPAKSGTVDAFQKMWENVATKRDP